MLVQKLGEMVFTGHQWLLQNLMIILKKKNQLFKLEIHLQKNYLLEACLELMKDDSIIAIQDMGAAGLTSSSVEMASKGSLGIELRIRQSSL